MGAITDEEACGMDKAARGKSQRFGIVLVLSCGTMWGISGVLGQYVFSHSDLDATQLTIVRLLITGIVLLLISAVTGDKRALTIWSRPKDILSLLFFSLTGVMGVQLTYFASIEASNAATGTVIQFTYIIMLLLYTTIFMHKKPKIYEAAAVVCAFAGIFLIATHGSFHSLAVSGSALVWGLCSAVCFSIYCLFPQKLYNSYGLATVIGWGSFIMSVFLMICTGNFPLPHMSTSIAAAAIAVAVVGTLIPFTLYGIGIGILGSVKASLFVTVEPVVSALLTWLLFDAHFTVMDICGFLLILGSIQIVAILTFRDNRHIAMAEQSGRSV